MTADLECRCPGPRPASAAGPEDGRQISRSGVESWYDATWNPTVGCSAQSPGCEHCTALQTVARLARVGGKSGARYAGIVQGKPGGADWTGAIVVHEDLLTWPLLRRDTSRLLVGSLSDLFHEELATATLDRIHAAIAVAHWHRFLVLTKRARRMREYYDDPETPRRIAVEIDRLAAAFLQQDAGRAVPGVMRLRRRWAAGFARVLRTPGAAGNPVGLDPWPLPNLFPGVSVEDSAHLGRIAELAQMPAAFRWVCFEPLLGPVRPDAVPIGGTWFDALLGLRYSRGARDRVSPLEGRLWPPLDWVVVGGEIGAGGRPMHPDWVRALRDQCAEAGAPFLFRRWGEWAPALRGGGEPMVRIGHRRAGRLIDGRSWDLLPTQLQP